MLQDTECCRTSYHNVLVCSVQDWGALKGTSMCQMKPYPVLISIADPRQGVATRLVEIVKLMWRLQVPSLFLSCTGTITQLQHKSSNTQDLMAITLLLVSSCPAPLRQSRGHIARTLDGQNSGFLTMFRSERPHMVFVQCQRC